MKERDKAWSLKNFAKIYEDVQILRKLRRMSEEWQRMFGV